MTEDRKSVVFNSAGSPFYGCQCTLSGISGLRLLVRTMYVGLDQLNEELSALGPGFGVDCSRMAMSLSSILSSADSLEDDINSVMKRIISHVQSSLTTGG